MPREGCRSGFSSSMARSRGNTSLLSSATTQEACDRPERLPAVSCVVVEDLDSVLQVQDELSCRVFVGKHRRVPLSASAARHLF